MQQILILVEHATAWKVMLERPNSEPFQLRISRSKLKIDKSPWRTGICQHKKNHNSLENRFKR